MFRQVSVVAVLLFAASSFAAEDDAKKALKSLEGDWKVTKMIAAGEVVEAKMLSFTIKGDQIIPSDSPKDSATIKLDPSTKPTSIEFKDTHNEKNPGIYLLDGDKLTLCFAKGKGAQPKEFQSTKASDTVLIELIKVKK